MQLNFSPPFDCFPIQVPAQSPKSMHIHEMHEFFFCLNSRGKQFTGSRSLRNRRHSLFCFPAGVPHYCSGEPSVNAKGVVIMIPDSMFSSQGYGDPETQLALQKVLDLARQGEHPLPLDQANAKDLSRIVNSLATEFTKKKAAYQAAVRSRLQDLFVLLARDKADCQAAKSKRKRRAG